MTELHAIHVIHRTEPGQKCEIGRPLAAPHRVLDARESLKPIRPSDETISVGGEVNLKRCPDNIFPTDQTTGFDHAHDI
jgi:hypothetical protein